MMIKSKIKIMRILSLPYQDSHVILDRRGMQKLVKIANV